MRKIKGIIGLCSLLITMHVTAYGTDYKGHDFIEALEKASVERVLVWPKGHVNEGEEVISIALDNIAWAAVEGENTILKLKDPIQHEDMVIYKEPDYIRKVTTTHVNQGNIGHAAYERTGVNALKEMLKGIKGEITIAVIDSGIDSSMPLFDHRLVDGYDFIEKDDDPQDGNGHGTSVAGIIANATTKNIKIMPLRTLDDHGTGHDSTIARAIRYAMEHGAEVINLSLVGMGFSKHLDDAINDALQQDIIVVAGAGNDCIDTKHVYPAGKDDIIVVSAVNENDNISLFSNYGDTIDIAAPGEQIDALLDGYHEDGTSFAAPYISAIAGMMRLLNPEVNTPVMEELLSVYSDDVGLDLKDKAYGHGIVNVNNFSMDESFDIISRKKVFEPYTSGYLKVYSSTGNRRVHIAIDGRDAYTYAIKDEGYFTITFDVDLPAGKHQVDVYLEEADQRKKMDTYTIEVLDYNFIFEVYNERHELSTDYILRLSGGIDNEDIIYLGDDKQQGYFKNGRYYMTLDMASLLETYDYLLAICEPADMNNDGHKVPIYCKKLLTTGQKSFKPVEVQTILYEEASYANIYMSVNDGIKNQYQWVGFDISQGQQELLLDYGEHRVFISANHGSYLYTLQNDYYLILDEHNLKEVVVDTSNITNKHLELLTHVAYMDTVPVPYESYNAFDKLEDVTPVLYNPNRYRFYATLNHGLDGLSLYKDIDLMNHDEAKITFGNTLTNAFVFHYFNEKRQVLVKIMDDYDNRYIMDSEKLKLILENTITGKTYEGNISYNDTYQGIEPYEMYDFSYEHIPDGYYRLRLELEGEFMMPISFSDAEVIVKGGTFYKNARRRAPRLKHVRHVFSIEPYHTFELNLTEVFSSKDELFYTVDQGYVMGDTLFFEGNERGVYTFNVTAHNFKEQSTTFTFQVIINDDIRFNDGLEDGDSKNPDKSLLELLFKTYDEPNDTEDRQDKKIKERKIKRRKEDRVRDQGTVEKNIDEKYTGEKDIRQRHLMDDFPSDETEYPLYSMLIIGLSAIIIICLVLLIIVFVHKAKKEE